MLAGHPPLRYCLWADCPSQYGYMLRDYLRADDIMKVSLSFTSLLDGLLLPARCRPSSCRDSLLGLLSSSRRVFLSACQSSFLRPTVSSSYRVFLCAIL